ncbi:xylulokinase [Microterricola pindariensis]|uniref:Xylulose kinase n=1 Tax=Microterricola pindariensis TaxID=478010 RepID=A0ABX5AYI9_9MICO|nr:xylulokinase [Microterricola pindariensis]PPL19966.1 xylulokinase [Microterricola pindariensis]
MNLVAGVDSSTQSCKVLIVDADTGHIVRSGRAAHPDGTEVDPEAWWLALLEALADAGGLADVSAISVGGQQHGMVALDVGGCVIRPALLWNDTRSAAAAEALTAQFGAEEYAERTGVVPVASFTASKLRWLRDVEPGNAAQVAAVALPHDWLSWRLRGYGPEGSAPLGPMLDELCTDRSDASGTAYWSPITNDYDRELLLAALGHDAVLPRVLAPDESGGEVHASVLGASSDATPIVLGPGAGDNAAAAFGLGARSGDVVVSIGTSGTVFAVTDRPSRDATGTVAGFADASGAYLPLVAALNAARVLDAVAGLLGIDHDELGRLALEAEPGAGGAVLVPWFEGERTPNLPGATAGLSGLTLANTTRSSVARAAIEGLLCGLADGLEAVLGQGVQARRLLLIGGAAQNPAVQAIAAQVFALPVVVPTPGEYVAIGAARQAAWVLAGGAAPEWPLATVAAPAVDHRPVIRAQYAVARDERAAALL